MQQGPLVPLSGFIFKYLLLCGVVRSSRSVESIHADPFAEMIWEFVMTFSSLAHNFLNSIDGIHQ